MRNRLLIFLTSQSCCLTDTSDKSSKSPWSQMDLLPPLMQAELVQLFLPSRTEISSQFQKAEASRVGCLCSKRGCFCHKRTKNYGSKKINVFSLDERKRFEKEASLAAAGPRGVFEGCGTAQVCQQYGRGHLWTFCADSALCVSPSIFPTPSRSPLASSPPLSVDFSTSETKQTRSCVSGLVTLRALPEQHSCFFVCPPSSTFSAFLQQAPMPVFPALS